MIEYRMDCGRCTNKAWSIRFQHHYCLPHIANGKSPIVLHLTDKASNDYFTCDEYTTAPREEAVYELAKAEGVL